MGLAWEADGMLMGSWGFFWRHNDGPQISQIDTDWRGVCGVRVNRFGMTYWSLSGVLDALATMSILNVSRLFFFSALARLWGCLPLWPMSAATFRLARLTSSGR